VYPTLKRAPRHILDTIIVPLRLLFRQTGIQEQIVLAGKEQ